MIFIKKGIDEKGNHRILGTIKGEEKAFNVSENVIKFIIDEKIQPGDEITNDQSLVTKGLKKDEKGALIEITDMVLVTRYNIPKVEAPKSIVKEKTVEEKSGISLSKQEVKEIIEAINSVHGALDKLTNILSSK